MSRRRAGFSLIELVMVIVVVAIAAVAIGSGFAYIARSQALSADLQRASQIAQECADYIIGLGRKPGTYAGVAPVANNSAICNVLPAAGGTFIRTVDIANVAGAGVQFCAAGWVCKRVRVTVRRGQAVVELNFMVINY
jgi:prepilin-type N-terminal cleavage/methylation domain-containing protein